MKQEELAEYIRQKVPNLEMEPLAHDLTFLVPLEKFLRFCSLLKNDQELLFDNLMCMTAVDNLDSLELVYFFSSYEKRHRVAVKVRVNGEKPEAPTVTELWPGANWHERETYDLFGVSFKGHPDLRRILLSDDWEGYPMRKKYKHWNLTPLPDDVTEVTKDYLNAPFPIR